jgi:hypothetical protein
MKQRIVITLLLIAALCSCKRNEPTTWDSDVLVPVANGRITLDDILADSLLYGDADGLWHFRFNKNLTDFDLDTLVEIPDTVITKSFIVPLTGGPFTIPPGQTIISEEENNLINVNDALLREVRVKSGFLMYSVKSYIDGYLDCVYQLPGVTLDGTPTVIQTITQPGTDASPFVYNGSIDLSGYHIDLTGQSGFMFNRIFSDLQVSSAQNAPGPTLVSGNDSLQIELKFVDPVVSYARGYFGQHHYDLNESVSFSDDVNFPDGLLKLDDAVMRFEIVNSVGIDARMEFSEISNFNTQSNQEVLLQHAPLYQPLNISRAYDQGGEILQAQYVLELNNSNSNITSFIENLPDQFNMQADVLINPLGDITDGNDFIYTDKALKATLDIDIPLRLAAQNLVLTDSLALDPLGFELGADGYLELIVDNSFPFEAMCDLTVIGTDQNISLMNGQVIAAAIPTEVEHVTVPVNSVLRIPVNELLLDALSESSTLVVRMRLQTPEFDQVHGLYEHFYMDFRLVANGLIEMRYE